MASPSPEYLAGLNSQQEKAVLHGCGPLLILAGAGSGKTRVITCRIARLLAEGIFSPDQVLAVTFTNKAAREMQHRIQTLTGVEDEMQIRTFHSFCAWLLRRNAAAAGLDPYFSIYDDEDSLALLKTLVSEQIQPAELKELARRMARAKDLALGPEDDLRPLSANPLFQRTYQAYEAALAQAGNVDFGGLILKTLELLRDHPGIRTRIQQKFPLILVDEYQDSNLAQFELLKLLTGPTTWLSVVGDDDQSIYGFRGAEVENILKFSQNFPGTEVIKLEENYRSSAHILALASDLVAHNSGRLEKTLWTQQGPGHLPVLRFMGDQEEEVRWVVDLIKKAPLTQTAILYRTNAQSRAFEAGLVQARIPYRIVGSLRFYEREEIKDMMAWLAFLANPRDTIGFLRILNKPARGLGKTSVEKIRHHQSQSGGNWLEACLLALGDLSTAARAKLEKFIQLTQDFQNRLDSQDLAQTVHQLILETGLGDLHQEKDSKLGSSKMENLGELVSAASLFSEGRDSLAAFLERVTLDTTEADSEVPMGTVTLITMHNTKGLEFDRVIITGLEDGLFPHANISESPKDLEEERRLFYVALTRAKKELFLSTCRRRMLHGKTQDRSPSRFLEELPKDHLDQQGDWAPKKTQGMAPGTRVYREDFGAGYVVKSWIQGESLAVEVRFDSGRRGVFIPQFTPLERISDD